MRYRLNTVLVSSIILSLSLAALIPPNLSFASTWRRQYLQGGPGFWTQNYLMPIGFASLAIVMVSLIVVWAAYLKTARWAWFCMLIVVWIFVFPVYVLPLLLHIIQSGNPRRWSDWSAWIGSAVRAPGVDRDAIKGPCDFLIMGIALLLPVRSFFFKHPNEHGRDEGSDGLLH